MAISIKKKSAPAEKKVLDVGVKTKQLGRAMVSVDALDPQPNNPNEMSDRQFNLLVDNIQRMGLTDPVLVRPLDDGRFRIVGGEHRWRAAKVIGLTEVPVTIVNSKEFTEDEERFQVVRHNIIKGRLSPKKFLTLYESLSQKYSDEVAAESFGFAEEEEFKKLIKTTAESLPPEMKEQFKEAAKEVKTLDDLAKLLNHLFSTYGDTLPYGYMIFDFGGKDSVWLRMTNKSRASFDVLSHRCRLETRALDHIMEQLLEYAAGPDMAAPLEKMFSSAKEVKFKDTAPAPTLDFLDEMLK